jgi:hypothetical protein
LEAELKRQHIFRVTYDAIRNLDDMGRRHDFVIADSISDALVKCTKLRDHVNTMSVEEVGSGWQ